MPASVGGMDVSYGRRSAYACIVTIEYPSLAFRSRAEARSPLVFPYIPGFLAFREIPALLEVTTLALPLPDLLIVHGHGYAHPRRVGLATHIGAILGIPSIGIAGQILSGMRASVPGGSPGSSSHIILDGEIVGALLRTRKGARPVCVSAGYGTNLVLAQKMTLQCCRGSRFPEPLVRADAAARKMLRRCE